MESKFENLLDTSENDAGHKARLLASSQDVLGTCMKALPSSFLGLGLDNETLRISAALRIGGQEIDRLDYHRLLS